MALTKRPVTIDPAPGLRVLTVAALAECKDVPEAVKFPMLTEQVLTAQEAWVKVPDPHD
jgi:hypothetical protein